jgi:hypothetical protein
MATEEKICAWFKFWQVLGEGREKVAIEWKDGGEETGKKVFWLNLKGVVLIFYK